MARNERKERERLKGKSIKNYNKDKFDAVISGFGSDIAAHPEFNKKTFFWDNKIFVEGDSRLKVVRSLLLSLLHFHLHLIQHLLHSLKFRFLLLENSILFV